jgi:NADPH:quinone reductase-like Zn-dependent oxidoreductase
VTVGSEDKAKFIMEAHGIPRDHIFNSRDESFKDDILKATHGRGVDIVVNSLPGELLHASWKCVAAYGMMVEIGKTDLIGEGRLAMEIFEQNRGYHGVDVSKTALDRPALTTRFDDFVLIQEGKLTFDKGTSTGLLMAMRRVLLSQLSPSLFSKLRMLRKPSGPCKMVNTSEKS